MMACATLAMRAMPPIHSLEEQQQRFAREHLMISTDEDVIKERSKRKKAVAKQRTREARTHAVMVERNNITL